MSKQHLIYSKLVPLSSERHGEFRLQQQGSYAFAGNLNFIPVTLAEFAAAASELPVVFVRDAVDFMPVMLTGLRESESLLVDESGRWNSAFVPAFLKRYPFLIVQDEASSNFNLYVDEDCEAFAESAAGESLFVEGSLKPTDFLHSVLRYQVEYQRQLLLTRRFSSQLAQLGLLKSVSFQYELSQSEPASLSGLYSIDKEALRSVSDAALLSLIRSGGLELIYQQLNSLKRMDALVGLLAKRETERLDLLSVWNSQSGRLVELSKRLRGRHRTEVSMKFRSAHDEPQYRSLLMFEPVPENLECAKAFADELSLDVSEWLASAASSESLGIAEDGGESWRFYTQHDDTDGQQARYLGYKISAQGQRIDEYRRCEFNDLDLGMRFSSPKVQGLFEGLIEQAWYSVGDNEKDVRFYIIDSQERKSFLVQCEFLNLYWDRQSLLLRLEKGLHCHAIYHFAFGEMQGETFFTVYFQP